MKILIPDNSLKLEDLKTKLVGNFPNYKFKDFRKNMIIASKSSAIGANIILHKNRVIIAGNFPTFGGRLLFILSILLLGVIIPLIIYFSVFLSKFSKLEKELGKVVQEEFGIKK